MRDQNKANEADPGLYSRDHNWPGGGPRANVAREALILKQRAYQSETGST